MGRKRHKPEEIVAKLRQFEVLTSQGRERGRCDPLDRRDGGDLLPLWTALPLQVDFDLIRLAGCKHLSGVTR
jgi:hypothetical protein